jgi:hypothetical protein
VCRHGNVGIHAPGNIPQFEQLHRLSLSRRPPDGRPIEARLRRSCHAQSYAAQRAAALIKHRQEIIVAGGTNEIRRLAE